MRDLSKYDYEERASEQDRDDYWGQVRRTVKGRPVGEDQIELICDAIKCGLDLSSADKIIDVGCGNGALIYRFQKDVYKILGIDRSDYLISVAKESFQAKNIEYIVGDVLSVLKSSICVREYNKALLYGVFSFFDDELALSFFEYITKKTNIRRLFIGNVRDRLLAEKFYKRPVSASELDDSKSSMGVWRTREYFTERCERLNWKVEFSKMPKEFYANEYYFDVCIHR
ncbi:MAG: class I SAM-dependent methyltransferase [Gammaproteobacteria bacterium]|nr:class I SAM-dependent methyltransferase [Gammaproteobacteria bacterium]